MRPIRSAFLALFLCIGLCSCGYKGLVAGYSTIVTVKQAGSHIEGTLAKWLRAETVKCVTAMGSRTPDVKKCLEPKVKIVKDWGKARAGINAANEAAFAALKLYHDILDGKAKGKKPDWIKVIAKSVCGLLKAAESLEAILPSIAKVTEPLKGIKGLVCL